MFLSGNIPEVLTPIIERITSAFLHIFNILSQILSQSFTYRNLLIRIKWY